MDTIRLVGVQAMGTHGVLDYEHVRAQPFVVDATLYLNLATAGRSDDLHDTVDYGRVAKRIVSIIEGEHVDLIERLATLIAKAVLAEDDRIGGVKLTVHKPKAPITVPFTDVSVTIERWRDGRAGDNGNVAMGSVSVKSVECSTGACDADVSGTAVTRNDRTSFSDSSYGSRAIPSESVALPAYSGKADIHRVIIALGGNQGDVAATMRDALASIDALPGTQIRGVSSLYRTAAWGMPEGTPDFLNAVVEISTTMSADQLLHELQMIEVSHGRTRETHWGSRTLDLDIVDFDGVVSDDPDLTLPHPRAWQRAFVLAPWLDLDAHAVLQGEHGGPVAQLLHEAGDRDSVYRLNEAWMTSNAMTNDAASNHPNGFMTPSSENDSSDDNGDGNSDRGNNGSSGSNGNDSDGSNGNADNSITVSADDSATESLLGPEVKIHTAIVSMDSTSTNAETLFRTAIVALEGMPGNQVEGISPLYHVAHFEGPDAMSAVVQLTTRMDARAFIAMLGSVESSLPEKVDLDLVDMPGVVCDEPDCRVPWPSARRHASVLAPWMDMDSDATLAGDPVSYLLALAPDAERVGLLSDTWIVGSTS